MGTCRNGLSCHGTFLLADRSWLLWSRNGKGRGTPVCAGVGISAAVLLGIWVKKGLRCEMEESVVPCYLDGYLWETYSVQFLSTLCAHKEGMAEEKKKPRFWDQTGLGEGDERGEVKHFGKEFPSLSSGHPFSREKPDCVCRKGLYEVVSSKDSWKNEANPSLYLMRMLFFVVVKWDYHLCLPKRQLCEFHVWGITYAGIVL